jgi:hypothetical protein
MVMNEEQKINPFHLRIAGEKIQSSVMYVYFNFIVSIIGMVIAFNSEPKSIGIVVTLFSLIGIVLIIASLVNLNSAGFNLISSVSSSQKIVETSEGEIRIENYPNGTTKVKKSFNKDGKKHGLWEYYSEDGSLEYEEVYENDEFVTNVKK